MKPPSHEKQRLQAARDPLALNGYAGAYFEHYGISPPKADTRLERVRECAQRLDVLASKDETYFTHYRELLDAAADAMLRAAIHARAEFSRVNLMRLTRRELILVLTTRADPADIIALSDEQRAAII